MPAERFNPSIGILDLRTSGSPGSGSISGLFQSLDRDSGPSDKAIQQAWRGQSVVSIPRSGFWTFGRFHRGPISRRPTGCGFQSLDRDSGPSDDGFDAAGDRITRTNGFNPSIGILDLQTTPSSGGCKPCFRLFQSLDRDSGPFRRIAHVTGEHDVGKFQSLDRDSGLSDFPQGADVTTIYRFQSLDRDSGPSDRSHPGVWRRDAEPVSIPRSGFWTFRHSAALASRIVFESLVSIPRSGFWTFRRSDSAGEWRVGQSVFQSLDRDSGPSDLFRSSQHLHLSCCFNPSIGILGLQTPVPARRANGPAGVSIPRSGFWAFRLTDATRPSALLTGSNPSIGILGLQTGMRGRVAGMPDWVHSIGILGLQTNCSCCPPGFCGNVSIPRSGFWAFRLKRGGGKHCRCIVSIPRSGFWAFRRLIGSTQIECLRCVSIPRSGFWAFRHDLTYNCIRHYIVSIPRSGFWAFRRGPGAQTPRHLGGFNPSIGILGLQTFFLLLMLLPPLSVSIPRSGFWAF